MDKTGYKKVELGNSWNYKELGKGAEFKGVYLSKEENVGDNNSILYSFDVDGDVVNVWGSTLLDTRLKNVKYGEEVIIEYLGEEESQKRKGAKYHNFDVYHRPMPMQKVEVDESDFTL